jgi:hypothetical protein
MMFKIFYNLLAFFLQGPLMPGPGLPNGMVPFVPFIARTQIMRFNDRISNHMNGDTYRCTHAVSGVRYCAYNDGTSSGGSPPGIGDRNVGFFSLVYDPTDVNSTTITFINSTSAYGVKGEENTNGWTNNTTWKSAGVRYISGNIYVAVKQDPSNFQSLNVTLIMSPDLGQHWCNPKTFATGGSGGANTCDSGNWSATGDPPQGPTADSAVLWPSTGPMARPMPVVYTTGDTTDGNPTTCYWVSSDSTFSAYYLAKVACGTGMMTASNWKYFTGAAGSDVTNDANFCTTSYAACKGAMTALPGLYGGYNSVLHLPAPWNTYYTMADVANTPGVTSKLGVFNSNSLSSTYTLIDTDTDFDMQNFPQFFWDTLTVVDSGSKLGTVTAISGGDYSNGDQTNYSPYWNFYTITNTAIPTTHTVGSATSFIGGSSSSSTPGFVYAIRKFTMTENGLLQKASVYCSDTDGGVTKLHIGIYNDNGGVPGTVLALDNHGAPTNGGPGWCDSVSLAPVPLVNGNSYWIATLVPSGSGGAALFYYDAGSGSGHLLEALTSSQTKLPNPFGTSKDDGVFAFSAYVTYIPY